MLQKMRDKTQSWVTKLIVGLICLAFAVWGLESLVMPGSGGDKKIAKVNGEAITQQQYYDALQSIQRRIAQKQMPIDASRLHETVMKGLIQQAVLLSYAKHHQMIVSDQDLDGLIMNMPAFQTNGKFDNQRFISLLRNSGLTPQSFKAGLRKDILLTQIQTAITSSAFVTPAQLKSFAALEQQKRTMQWATLLLSKAESQQEVSKSAIENYYQTHQSDFMTPEKVSVNYILLTQGSLAKGIKVSENDVQSAYQAYVSKADANVKPEVSIILLKTDAKNSVQSQLKKASSLEEKLKKGAGFGKLAKQYSEDKVSAEKQGYIGHVTPGFYGNAFDNAVAVLIPGEISSPIETKFGVVIIKRVDNGKATVKPFKEMQSALVAEIQEQQAVQLFQDKSQKLADISFEAADLTQPAKSLHLKIESTPFFSREGGEGITANKQFIKAAFSHDVMMNGNNSDPVQISPTEVVVLHVKDTQPSRQQTLAEVIPVIEKMLKKQQASQTIMTDADKIVAALHDGKSDIDIAKTYHLAWQKAADAGRQQKDVPASVLGKAFALPLPDKHMSAGSVVLPSGDVAVVAVSKVIPGSGKFDDTRKNMVAQALAENQGQMDYADFSKELHNQATIKMLVQNHEE